GGREDETPAAGVGHVAPALRHRLRAAAVARVGVHHLEGDLLLRLRQPGEIDLLDVGDRGDGGGGRVGGEGGARQREQTQGRDKGDSYRSCGHRFVGAPWPPLGRVRSGGEFYAVIPK